MARKLIWPTTPLAPPPRPKKAPKPRPKRPTPVPPVLATFIDRPIQDEEGAHKDLEMPVGAMSRASYDREMHSSHLGYREFLKNRGLDTLKLALSRDGSAKAKRFLGALVNPKYRKMDIATLAEKFHVGLGELMAVWRNDRLTDALENLFAAAPTVAEHTAIDAQSVKVCCPRCDGSGMMKINREDVMSWVECIPCSGTGAIRRPGDRDARRYVFEAVGIIKAGTGLNVNINTGAASSVESVIDEMERAPAIAVSFEMGTDEA